MKKYRATKINCENYNQLVKFIEVFEGNSSLKILIYYSFRFSERLKVLDIPESILRDEYCFTFEDAVKFLRREGLETVFWSKIEYPFYLESTIHFVDEPIISNRMSFKLVNKSKSRENYYTMKHFEEILDFKEKTVEIKISMLIENEFGVSVKSYCSYGKLFFLNNEYDKVSGFILVSKIDDSVLFLEKTDILNCLILDNKYQKKIGEGKVISLSIQAKEKSRMFYEKSIMKYAELRCNNIGTFSNYGVS